MAPNDVQFSLPFTNEESDDSIQPPENIVIQSNSYDNSLCVDTSAFVGKTSEEKSLKKIESVPDYFYYYITISIIN